MIKDTKKHRKCRPLLAVAICTMACVVALTRFERTMTAAGEIVPDQPRVMVPAVDMSSANFVTQITVPPCHEDATAEVVEPDEPQIVFNAVIAELPAEEKMSEPNLESMKIMGTILYALDEQTGNEDIVMTNETVANVFQHLEKEEKLTILSRPQIMSMDNQLAVVCVGSQGSESNYFLAIVPRLSNDRVVAMIALNKGVTENMKSTEKTQKFEGIVTLRENEPFVGFLSEVPRKDGQEGKKLLFCITAKVIPPKKGSSGK